MAQNIVSMKALLEAGVHFGHQTRRWNPKMAPYIYTERNGIYIIDLQKTVKKLEEAYNFVRELSENGKSILFVGTKKQAQDAIRDEALRCNMYYVNARWLGGMMTNFKTMRTRVDRLNQLKAMQPGTPFDMETHVVALTENTIAANSRFFEKESDVPRRAFTMGPKNIMDAKKVLILAVGTNKADAVRAMVEGEVTESLPASILQKHPDCILIADEGAAFKLSKK